MNRTTNGLATITKRARNILGLSGSDPADSDSGSKGPLSSRPAIAPSTNSRDPFGASNLAELQRQIKEQAKKTAACVRRASVDSLVEVPGRRRTMRPEDYKQLVESLRNHRQVEPIAVVRRSDGRLEIVSGHHRVDACRELGLRDVPVVVVDLASDDVGRGVFFANAIRAPLSDYEMFRGLGEERHRHLPPLSLADLGLQIGFDRRRVSALFAFEKLPGDALALLESNPHAVGTTCAASLAKLMDYCEPELIVEAVQMLVEGKLQQSKAATWVKAQMEPRTDRSMDEPIPISTFCSYTSSGKTLRIEFKSRAERETAEVAIEKYLRELAEREG